MSARCPCCRASSAALARDVLDLAAAVLSGSLGGEYERVLDVLERTPRLSLQALSTVLLAVADDQALEHVRYMAAMRALHAAVGGA